MMRIRSRDCRRPGSGIGRNSTYAVLGLRSDSILALASILDRNPLLAVDGFARDEVGGSKQVLLATTSDEHALVTMRLDDNLLAALCTLRAARLATTAAAACTESSY
jgi:hypothetical protein